MAKFKRQSSMVIKRDGDDVYLFKNGVAVVPGCRWQRKPMQVTIKEFNEAQQELRGESHERKVET